MTAIATPPKMQFVDSNGKPLVGGKLYTYAAGTTTPLATYTDYAGGTPNANPIILNSRGEADVWLGTARYKFKLTTSTNVDVWTVDNVGGMATLAQLAASGGSALVGYLPAGTGAVATTVQAKLRESVSVKDFGAVGDGVTDDTAAIQAAFNTGYFVTFPNNGVYKISSALTYSGAGIDMPGSAGILVTGTGYTGLIITTPTPHSYFGRVYVYGTGQVANGILLNNPAGVNFGMLRAYNFAGYGIKINKCWDCVFASIASENCGTSSEYAFSMNDDGDTCNMTNINHLQVELSKKKAIYISPNTLSAVIQNIHSERIYPDIAYTTWHLGGNRCTYINVRLNGAGTSDPDAVNASCRLDGYYSSYTNLLVEGLAQVSVDANSNGGISLIEPELGNTYQEVASQSGIVKIFGGQIAVLTGQLTNTRKYGTKIGTGVNAFVRFESQGTQKSISASSFFDVPLRPTAALLIVRDKSSGGAACYLLDETGVGSALISGPANFVLGAAGANQIGVTLTGSALRISNGYATTKLIDVGYLGG